jgi:hypothetical protein
MAESTRELFLKALDEWGRYAETFRSLPEEEQISFLKAQGYASVRELLAHVAVWWEEARGIIEETIKHDGGPGRTYDFAAFNAAAIQRFQDTPDAEFMAWYEAERQRMSSVVSALNESQLQVRRIQNWLDAVLLQHLKEHGCDAPRFLLIDTLHREWGDYLKGFAGLTETMQAAFLKKQGFDRFRDVLAHVVAWWEHGIGVIESSASEDSGEVDDVDSFNAEAVERFSLLEEPQVVAKYEDTRLALASLVDMLPDEVLSQPRVRSWLRADVIDHYYEHAL